MTNVSKQPLSPEQQTQITRQISALLADKTAAGTNTILNNLLGPEEQLMIAKRFAIIVMLWKQHSMYEIAQKLHVSTSTVARIEQKYQQGKYADITKLFHKPSVSITDILEGLDAILHLGGILPHYGNSHNTEKLKTRKRH